MSNEKAKTQTQTPAKQTDDLAKPEDRSAKTQKQDVNEVESKKEATNIKPTSPSRFTFKKVIPAVVLLLAGGIFIGITGGWNGFIGGRGKQKTDDAFLRAD